MKKLLLVVSMLFLLGASTFTFAAEKPKTVIHVITVKWKDTATEAQIASALRAAETMQYPGLLRVWTNPIKMQLPEGYKNIIVMEFASPEALQKYADSPAQKKFYDTYMPLREESRTHDITN